MSSKPDSNTYFSEDRKSGILKQPKFNQAIYFVNNENIDTFIFEENVSTNDLDRWVEAKRKHYDNLITK